MGRLIDSEYLKEDMKRYGWKHVDSTVTEYVDGLDTIEAIPKDQYEARLKADMVAMLEEIQLEIEENTVRWYVGRVDGKSDDVVLMETLQEIIQQKIEQLKESK